MVDFTQTSVQADTLTDNEFSSLPYQSMRMYPIFLLPDLARIPRQFDARYKREWRGYVSDVRDQGWCGASWAFSTLAVTQDR